jgi:HSP20 family protein
MYHRLQTQEVSSQMALLMQPEPFTREVDRLFDAFLGRADRQGRRWVPPVDLVEAEDHFVLKADLPGLTQDDVSIEVQDGTLSISGERKAEHEQHERGWYRIERAFGSFSRSMTLPEGIDPEGIKAEFHNGVLEVRIPKPEARKPRRIEISATDNGGPAALEGTAQEK